MKKQMTTAMAAAMAFGTVVPAFANETNQRAVILDQLNADQRRANGYGYAQSVGYDKVYNLNGTEDTSDDTVKGGYSEHKIVTTIKVDVAEGEEETVANDIVIVAPKLTTKETATAKKELDKLNEMVAAYQADKDYVVTPKEIEAKFEDGVYTEGQLQYKVTLAEGVTIDGWEDKTYTINGIDNLVIEEEEEEEVEKTDAELTSELRKELFNEEEFVNYIYNFDAKNLSLTYDYITSTDKVERDKEVIYNSYENLLEKIEDNKDKFTVFVDEGDQYKENKVVTVYRKDADIKYHNIVVRYTVANEDQYDEDFIVKIPEKNDFTGHWAEELIVAGMKSGEVVLSDTFRPNDSITRAEFAKLIATIHGGYTQETIITDYESGKNSESFSDVPNNSWYAPYVAYVQTQGIANGTKIDEEFSPHKAISREEAAVMIANITDGITNDIDKVKSVDLDGDGTKETHTRVPAKDHKFTDIATANAWADHAIDALSKATYGEDKKAVMGGYEDGTFRPQREITRAEALALVNQLRDHNAVK